MFPTKTTSPSVPRGGGGGRHQVAILAFSPSADVNRVTPLVETALVQGDVGSRSISLCWTSSLVSAVQEAPRRSDVCWFVAALLERVFFAPNPWTLSRHDPALVEKSLTWSPDQDEDDECAYVCPSRKRAWRNVLAAALV